jgi:DNA-binding LacI/PurR family transcriptional regulator
VRIDELGHRAMERLVSVIEEDGRSTGTSEQLDCELVVRQSCGAQGGARTRQGITDQT